MLAYGMPTLFYFLRGRFTREYIKEDIIAGITVGLVLIPQSLAYAQLAGLPPQYGLYASFLPPLVASLFGSSPQLATGPVAVLSLMTLASISPYATIGSPEYISYAILLALLLGIFLFCMGIFKLGSFISLLSRPVIYGFTNAAALIIASTQLSSFFGVTVTNRAYQYQTVIAVFQSAYQSLDVQTFALGIVSLLWMFLLKRIDRRLPYILIVTVLVTFSVWAFSYQTPLVGSIPNGFPSFHIPSFGFDIVSNLFLTVVAMALIGFTEGISIAQEIALKTKTHVNPNQELIGQGLSNIVGALGYGYPVSGSFSRTALNYEVGAKTWKSSLFTSLMVLVVIIFFTNFLFYLPKVMLAAIIIFSVSNLINFSRIKTIYKVNRYDAAAAVLTFFATLYFAPSLEKGVLVGVLFSLAHFVYLNTHPRIVFLSRYKDGSLHDAKIFNLMSCTNIMIVRFDAPLFFANASYFENEVIKYLSKHTHITTILFVTSGINYIDATGEEVLFNLVSLFKSAKKSVYFAGMKAPVFEILKKSGLVEIAGENHFYSSIEEALKHQLTIVDHNHIHIDKDRCPLLTYIPLSKNEEVQDHFPYPYINGLRAKIKHTS